MKKVVIVDDVRTARLALRYAIESDPQLKVVGEADNGAEALRLVDRLEPDIILIDVYLQDENGIDLTAHIMSTNPRPILIITGINPKDTAMIFRAMKAGALDVLAKLPSRRSQRYERERRRLVRLVKALSSVPVITRRSYAKTARKRTGSCASLSDEVILDMSSCEYEIMAVGASTGGPPVVCDLLTNLTPPFSLPIAIVQHISEGFVQGLTHWLAEVTHHEILLCDQDQIIQPGKVYLAPENHHLVMKSPRILGPSTEPSRKFQRPAVDELFESVAAMVGPRAIGIIMSGMGSDGTDGMKALHRSGALTIAQSPSSCVVDSMPCRAIESGSVAHVLSLDGIAEMVRQRTKDIKPRAQNE